jgi:WD40 repeat protein
MILTDVDISNEREETTVCSENGTLHSYGVTDMRMVRVIHAQECGVFHAVRYVTPHTLAVGSVHACHLFDLRAASQRPVHSLFIPPSKNTTILTHVTSLAVHPDRRHILATATNDGAVLVHDLRRSTTATTITNTTITTTTTTTSNVSSQSHGESSVLLSHNAHRGPVHEIAFFLPNPAHLLSVGEDGSLLLWDLSREGQLSSSMPQMPSLHRLVTANVPLLAFDYHASLNTLVCTAENDALIFTFDVFD